MSRVVVATMLALCTGPATADTAEDTVAAFVAAYNRHDVDGMLSLAQDNVRWMSIEGVETFVVASGKRDLESAMVDYFDNLPSARSEIRRSTALGNFVSLVEEAIWTVDGDRRSQCAVSVYELEQGLIKNVWYFDSQPCGD